jgi:SAM-dependent methyltransferase
MKTESVLMVLFKKLGCVRMAWSLRRLHCPVAPDALVLEVGSGGNPYWRANVLCDAYLDTSERHFAKLISDRPTVLAFTEKLPFADDTFDFVIASHVLEHSDQPEKFLSEIQRVAKAGYIEVPDAFFERLGTYSCHRSEITDRDGVLMIRKKRAYIQDPEIYELHGKKTGQLLPKWMNRNPFEFHVRYYWSRVTGGIEYRIVNPDYIFDWTPEESARHQPQLPISARFKAGCLHIFRLLLSQTSRNSKLRVQDLLRCPACHSLKFSQSESNIQCRQCQNIFPIRERGILDFTDVMAKEQS